MTLDMMKEALEYLRKEAAIYKTLLNEKVLEVDELKLQLGVLQKQLVRYENLFARLHIKITEELDIQSNSEEEKQK